MLYFEAKKAHGILPRSECDNPVNTLLQVQHGVRGTVLDKKNNQIEAAEISLSTGGQTVYSGKNGTYRKILRPGKYTISVTAPGF